MHFPVFPSSIRSKNRIESTRREIKNVAGSLVIAADCRVKSLYAIKQHAINVEFDLLFPTIPAISRLLQFEIECA